MRKQIYLYHLTNKENLPNIFKNGLELRIGHNSKQVHEKEPFIYLCRYCDIPYWKAILVLGIPLGIATNLANTKNKAAPIPVATTFFTESFFINFPSYV